MFMHVMAPPSQALTLQATAWGSKDLKHCKGLNLVVTNAGSRGLDRNLQGAFPHALYTTGP